MGDTAAPAADGAAQATDERAGSVTIHRENKDLALTPANLMRMALDGDSGLDAAMDRIAAGESADDVLRAPAQSPRMDGPQRRDREGKFADPEGRNRPAEKREQPAAEPKADAPPRFKSKAGKEYSPEQIELAIQLADRSSRIDKAFEARMAELREREGKLSEQERFAQEGLSLRDLAFNDFKRFRQLVEGATGRRLPIDGREAPEREETDDDFERLEREPAPRRRAAPAEVDDEDAPLTRREFKRLRDEERLAEDSTREERRFWNDIDAEIGAVLKEADPDLEYDDEDRETFAMAVGRKIGKEIKLGQLVVPALAKNVRGSTTDEVKRAVQLHAKGLLMRERSRLDRRSAKQLHRASEVAGATPSSVRNAATMLPGVDKQAREQADVPENIDDLIAGAIKLADEFERGEREGLEG